MLYFFFQAEDGIRDLYVTGVQTCALPIWARRDGTSGVRWIIDPLDGTTNFIYKFPAYAVSIAAEVDGDRSEERRVGKESKSQIMPFNYLKKTIKLNSIVIKSNHNFLLYFE